MSVLQATSALMCRSEGDAESAGGARPLRGATREARYIDLMRTMQFGELYSLLVVDHCYRNVNE